MNEKKLITDIDRIVDQTLLGYRTEPLDLLNIGDAEGEYRYLTEHREQYIRTVRDILCHFENADYGAIRILEIGSFLGLVSIVLSKIGFRVTAADIKEFISCKKLQNRFNEHGVNYVECNLRNYTLPFKDEEYDVVIMCETLEHLNFNPLPVIKEINRVMKLNGLFYLSLPNLVRFSNRLNLLEGKSIHNPIQHFFAQLDPNDNMIVGLHWREYTTEETKEMLEQMDFVVIDQKYEVEQNWITLRNGFERIVKKLISRIMSFEPVKKRIYGCILNPDIDQSLKPTQVTLALKSKMSRKEFHFTDTTLLT